jgi:hypothetical protein
VSFHAAPVAGGRRWASGRGKRSPDPSGSLLECRSAASPPGRAKCGYIAIDTRHMHPLEPTSNKQAPDLRR